MNELNKKSKIMEEQHQRPIKHRQYLDVVPPAHVRPNSSSRPIIVTNKPEQADPMVTSGDYHAPIEVSSGNHSGISRNETMSHAESHHSTSINNDKSRVVHAATPHHHLHYKSPWRWISTFVIILMFCMVVGDLLLDKGIWKPGHDLPHTHLFSQSN